MGKALYRTHRSKKLSKVIGQEHITDTLDKALKSGKISHAYLFTGPRGVGKTSVARILAHEVNKLPYKTDDSQHIDIIEIDAASNRRIDEIRDLRDKARLSPLQAPYKVYIIDEVHMLTREAFNALLKTLEEPPAHVIFILATTEAHKLPETIVSRTQRYSFKPIDTKQAALHLQTIAKKEKIKLDDAAAQIIARHGNGSFRDSINLLDQLRNISDQISEDAVRQHLGIPPDDTVEKIISSLNVNNPKELLAELDEAQSRGIQATVLARHLADSVRTALLKGELPRSQALKLLRGLLDVPGSLQPYQELELVLLENTLGSQEAVAAKPASVAAEPKKTKVIQDVKTTSKPAPNGDLEAALESGLWDQVLDKLRGSHNTLYGIARMASISIEGGVLVLGFAFDFHRRRFAESRNQDKVQAIITEIYGQPVEMRPEIDKNARKQAAPAPDEPRQPAKSDTLESITKVFGGGEVLED